MKIGVLTSGGDAPGMNAAIRAVVRQADALGHGTWGIYRGYQGLLEGDLAPLTSRSCANILQRGGTILQTARCPEFHDPAIRAKARGRKGKATRKKGHTAATKAKTPVKSKGKS